MWERMSRKSTLIKVITGAHRANFRRIMVRGSEDRAQYSVSCETVGNWRNLSGIKSDAAVDGSGKYLLWKRIEKRVVLDKKAMLEKCRTMIAELGVHIDARRECPICQLRSNR